jgi:ATP-dependent RNA helicase TDRD9
VTLGGSEVGYHVGHANHSLASTKLVFTTAGILLEELRAQGVSALTKYKVVIIDECHERSPESDLVLSLVKSMLRAHPNKNIRIILMSATFDHGRYRQYFSDVPGCDRIETITLETASSFETFYARVETHYFEKIILMLPDCEIHQSLQRSMRLDPDSEMRGRDGGKTLSISMLLLIRSLVAHLHTKEPIQGSFVIFAPTYRHLEQIYDMLLESGKGFKLGVLHSSVDMEYCLRSMKQSTSDAKHRKILLASAIADSSVTIPGVTCIIDLCRALQVKWDPSLKAYVPKTVWASKSICDQRKGRTGRTCPGRVFRLVPQGFYISRLENWEVPQLALSSCRDEALKLMCAGSLSDPSELLERCLDPPPKNVVLDALLFLESVGARSLS